MTSPQGQNTTWAAHVVRTLTRNRCSVDADISTITFLPSSEHWSSAAAVGQHDLLKVDVDGIAAKEAPGKDQTTGTGKPPEPVME